MSRRRKNQVGEELESSFELDLAPMLALMVTLIPIMLLSTVFVRVTIVETKLPQAVEQALNEDRNKKDREVSITLHMNKDKSFDLRVTEGGKVKSKLKLGHLENKWNMTGLHLELYKIKKAHPQIFRLDLLPDSTIPYKDIVAVMDEARNSKSNEPKIIFRDKKTNQPVETDLMFPDVIFSNVMEG